MRNIVSQTKVASRAWSPYLAGALTGLALTLAMLLEERQFGATPFYAWLSKGVGLMLQGYSLLEVDSLGRLMIRPTWFVTFALGIVLGSALAAWLFGDFKWQAIPAQWRARFGGSVVKRACWGFIGGLIALFGVRMATGCPSGLGLSGMAMLSASGFIGFSAFVAGGLLTARLLYPPVSRRREES